MFKNCVYFGLFLLVSCLGFDIEDDIKSFRNVDVQVQLSNTVNGQGTEDDPIKLLLNESLQITITDIRDSINKREVTDQIYWRSSDNDLAEVSQGLIVPKSYGYFSIRAQNTNNPDDTIQIGTWFFEILNLEKITITSSTGINGVLIGDELALMAKYFNNIGTEIETSFTWSSSDNNIATIDQTGTVSGVAEGNTIITVSTIQNNRTITATKMVNVVTDPTSIVAIFITGDNRVTVGENLNLTARAINMLSETLIDIVFTWASSDVSLATVNANGVVTGVAAGNVSITTSSQNITSEDFNITVEAVPEIKSRTGSFVSGRGSTRGTLTLFEDTDGSVKLRLNEDFFGAGIPGPVLYMSTSSSVTSSSLRIAEIAIGAGNNRVFDVPDVTLDQYDFVIYYCEPFRIVYGVFQLD